MVKEPPAASFLRYQLPAILWAGVIFVSSSVPSAAMPDLAILRLDKLIHFCVYFMFAFLAYRALRYQNRFPVLARRALPGTVLLILLYGASDEFHQLFVPGRLFDLLDLLADVSGACCLVGGVWLKDRFAQE